MTTATTAETRLAPEAARLARTLVRWLETGVRQDDLFSDQVFLDLSLPQWRLQASGKDAAFSLREDSHPYPGTVNVELLEPTSRGFLIQFEERWDDQGQQWYCREMSHCAVEAGRITDMAVYCTGDWDLELQQRHAEQVRLLRQ